MFVQIPLFSIVQINQNCKKTNTNKQTQTNKQTNKHKQTNTNKHRTLLWTDVFVVKKSKYTILDTSIDVVVKKAKDDVKINE